MQMARLSSVVMPTHVSFAACTHKGKLCLPELPGVCTLSPRRMCGCDTQRTPYVFPVPKKTTTVHLGKRSCLKQPLLLLQCSTLVFFKRSSPLPMLGRFLSSLTYFIHRKRLPCPVLGGGGCAPGVPHYQWFPRLASLGKAAWTGSKISITCTIVLTLPD